MIYLLVASIAGAFIATHPVHSYRSDPPSEHSKRCLKYVDRPVAFKTMSTMSIEVVPCPSENNERKNENH